MGTSALDKLSQGVQKATAELKKLRRENERLAEKAAKLEQRLEKAPEGAPDDSWAEERETIRQRLEDLADHLESVLGDD